ncbi:hypothetical protein NLX67_16030 [Domibacillus sp. A3M-37]|uniref:spr1630 family ClpXP-sensitive toxin n=1 Tax=Domibacillus sp. A3M-37 TaxID=2962037 RepID=UPI0020B7FEF4|nr:DUF5986 family protein [Domibacillus sp. A3M-37]MCP3763881.1 hypothetical protein [Domibacillus sp. A3M-37]
MTNYKLAEDLNQKIVDGIFEGYREYLDVRREKARTLKVSGAYAWVKGNHIDHQVAVSCEKYGVECKLAKAGLTWQYLEFNHDDEDTLFIVRNARYFNEEQVDRGRDAKGQTRNRKISYMENLMKINSNVDFKHVPTEPAEFLGQLELELIEDTRLSEHDNQEIAEVQSTYKRFYIVTYLIDEGQQIEQIRLWMPNPANNKAYLIDDLTKYISGAPVIDIDDELKDVLTNSGDAGDAVDAHVFGIALDAEEKKK